MKSRARGLRAVLAALMLLAPGCAEDPERRDAEPQIFVLAAIPPDQHDPANVRPGAIAWVCTRAGTATVTVSDSTVVVQGVVVTGGQLMVTQLYLEDLRPGENTIRIIVEQRDGGPPLEASASIYVSGA